MHTDCDKSLIGAEMGQKILKKDGFRYCMKIKSMRELSLLCISKSRYHNYKLYISTTYMLYIEKKTNEFEFETMSSAADLSISAYRQIS